MTTIEKELFIPDDQLPTADEFRDKINGVLAAKGFEKGKPVSGHRHSDPVQGLGMLYTQYAYDRPTPRQLAQP